MIVNPSNHGVPPPPLQVTKWEDFVPALEKQCMVLTPFCDQAEWEEKVKVSVLWLTCPLPCVM